MKFGYKGLVTFVEMFETVGILEIWVKGQRLTRPLVLINLHVCFKMTVYQFLAHVFYVLAFSHI